MAGSTSHFVRLNGCDYRCSFCDSWEAVEPTLIALPENHTNMTNEEIVAALLKLSPAKWVTISGGNPGMHKHLEPLIQTIQRAKFRVNCETQGSIWQDWMARLDELTISPKPPSSSMQTSWPALHQVYGYYQMRTGKFPCVKVVAFDDTDLDFAEEVVEKLELKGRTPFYIQVGTPRSHAPGELHDGPSVDEMNNNWRIIAERVMQRPILVDADARILPQLHLYLFGHGRGV